LSSPYRILFYLKFGVDWGPGKEYAKAIAVDASDDQTIEAIVTRDHSPGERIRPAIWPTALAFAVL
jgi:hypothetical protein